MWKTVPHPRWQLPQHNNLLSKKEHTMSKNVIMVKRARGRRQLRQ